jgi:hypothetical protein
LTFSLHSETRHKTLEEIAAAFGDEVVIPDQNAVAAEAGIFKNTSRVGHAESAEENLI